MTADVDIRPRAVAVAAWGVGGFAALLARAIWGLAPLAVDMLSNYELSPLQLAALIAWIVFMGYSEGYKGFQLQVAPRVAGRAMYAASSERPALRVLAPLFCMGLFHASRKRLIVSWSVLVGIVVLVVLVRTLSQPWRGIVDAGVVLGLTWGLLATLYYFGAALAGRRSSVPLDLPQERSPVASRPDTSNACSSA